jgi:hypothetical protein
VWRFAFTSSNSSLPILVGAKNSQTGRTDFRGSGQGGCNGPRLSGPFARHRQAGSALPRLTSRVARCELSRARAPQRKSLSAPRLYPVRVLSDVAVGLAVVAYLTVPSVICWLKGKKLWATLGFISGWHWIPVFRLAKPKSWWARRYYGDGKMQRARFRFPSDDPDTVQATPARVGSYVRDTASGFRGREGRVTEDPGDGVRVRVRYESGQERVALASKLIVLDPPAPTDPPAPKTA